MKLKKIEIVLPWIRSRLLNSVTSIFAINWQQGLEDFEDSKFGAQPYEVNKVNRMTTEWVPVKQDS